MEKLSWEHYVRSFEHGAPEGLSGEDIRGWELPEFRIHEFRPRATRYCFVVVTWDEGERIRSQLRRMEPLAHLADIIIADGDSQDGSMEHGFLKEQGVRALLVTREAGLSTATRMGLAYALAEGYEGIVTVDGNGKDGVDALPDFLASLEEGFGLVQGSRFMKGGYHANTPPGRYLGIRFVISPILFLASGHRFSDATNGFRAMSRGLLLDDHLRPFRKEFVRFDLQLYLNYSAARLGYRVKEIPVSRVYPLDGPVPTKIHGMSVFILLYEILKVALGCYDPRARKEPSPGL